MLSKLFYSLLLSAGLALVNPLMAQEGENPEVEGEATMPVSSSYIDLKPPFVANYGGIPGGRLQYLKADVSLRVESGGEMSVMHHMPAIRDKLLMLFSRQSEDSVVTVEGKELLRQEALEEVRSVLLSEEGEHKIKDLLFNSFIVQR